MQKMHMQHTKNIADDLRLIVFLNAIGVTITRGLGQNLLFPLTIS